MKSKYLNDIDYSKFKKGSTSKTQRTLCINKTVVWTNDSTNRVPPPVITGNYRVIGNSYDTQPGPGV